MPAERRPRRRRRHVAGVGVALVVLAGPAVSACGGDTVQPKDTVTSVDPTSPSTGGGGSSTSATSTPTGPTTTGATESGVPGAAPGQRADQTPPPGGTTPEPTDATPNATVR